MEVLTLSNCVLKPDACADTTVKISKDGVAIKTKEKTHVMTGDEIRDAELFYGARKMTMRIFGKSLYEIGGVDQNYAEELKRAFSHHFKINLYVKELEIVNVLSGELGINSRNALEFRSKKTIFDIPVDDIEGVVDVRNELCISLKGMEIRFACDSSTAEEIKRSCSSMIDDEILKIEGLSLCYPRGKFGFVFFHEYFRMVGSSYEHKIAYRGIKSLYVLEKGHRDDEEKYVVIGVDPCIRQGQTMYEYVALSFDESVGEVSANDGRLKKEYSGLLSDIFVEIMEALCVIRPMRSTFEANDGSRSLRCATKAYEGQLYPLDDCVLFLPKVFRLDLDAMTIVEFSRINLSTMQAKTFDMTIFCDKAYIFNGLAKDEFGGLEQYFHAKGIKARSEVIDDAVSSEHESEEYEDDSIVVDSDE
ncbi:putative Rttp106-like histone chaperone [Ordospora pajunii]|uniref:putative Rttp106-like histone chaperone n=1 Tax=Ordospora pajunii TaxID=3039483 RepID=UPI0029526832|nr:putative Rttp106-like histone chaperone [Ordospora pajunii]KAH9411117.1 putative Rttp106-like histone chaperone [Ordospora pajunii]